MANSNLITHYKTKSLRHINWISINLIVRKRFNLFHWKGLTDLRRETIN